MWIPESSLRPLPRRPLQSGLLWIALWEIQERVPVFPGCSFSCSLQVQWAAHGLPEQGAVLPHHSPGGGQQRLPYDHQSQGESCLMHRRKLQNVQSCFPLFCFSLSFSCFITQATFFLRASYAGSLNTQILSMPLKLTFPFIWPSLAASSSVTNSLRSLCALGYFH